MKLFTYFVGFGTIFGLSVVGKQIKYREAFPPEHEGYLPDSFKQRLREIAANEYLTGEARIDLVDKVYDRLPKSILMKLPLDQPIYQLPMPTQKKFRALMVDRSLGWRRRAQLYDQLVGSLPKNYQRMINQFAKTGDGKSSSSSSSSSSDEDSGNVDDADMQAGQAGQEMPGNDGTSGGGGSVSGGGGYSPGMSGGGGGGAGGASDDAISGYGGQEMISDYDKSGIDYDKYIPDSESDEKGAKGKPWSGKGQISKKINLG